MRILILFTLLLIPAWMRAQHNHFIYVQGENQQLFYLKKSGEVISSSTTGFLILPKLQPGTHQFIIGFPRDQYPEYSFNIEISGKDRGFTLKNYADRGWGLLDMQSLEVIMGKRIEVKKEAPPTYGTLSDDPFSMILASVVSDPGIRETSLVQSAVWVSAPAPKVDVKAEKPVAVKEDKKPETKATATPPVAPPPVVTAADTKTELKPSVQPDLAKQEVPEKKLPEPDKEQVAVKKSEPVVTEPIIKKEEKVEPPQAKPAEKYVAQKVVKISELKTWTGYQLTYIDRSGGTPDTIQVIIDDAPVEAAPAKTEPAVLNSAKLPRTDCKVMAREKDALNLRKKMLTIAKEEEMVETAMKELRNKCYTVEQLQNLSYVFVTDQGRLMLFEQAYPYIFDPANFHRLEKLLNNEEYLNKFKALIK
ncbi:MAG: DUF4476 domain-containing protein [Chitinophagaceae bacterium]